jgi:hypothetical protein
MGLDRKITNSEPRLSGQPRLTQRDHAALAWLVEQRAATQPQISTLLGLHFGNGEISERRGTQIIARWEELGLVDRRQVWHREPAVVWPTTQGAKLVGKSRGRRPAVGTLRHTLAVSEVRLRTCWPGSCVTWISEAQLRDELPKGSHLPDGGLLWQSGETTALEVELTPHGRSRVSAAVTDTLCQRLDGRDRFIHVLYLCGPETLKQVTTVREELPAHLQSRMFVRSCPS